MASMVTGPFRTIGHLWRLARTGRALARHDALIPHEVLAEAPLLARVGRHVLGFGTGKADASLRPGQRLALALEAMGPSFVKIGQVLATRPDVIGPDVARDLSALQDRLPPFADDLARAAIEEEFGAPLESLFAEFGPAVAAASIAQVHKARVKKADGSAGDWVAVKVLRPGIEDLFARELESFAFAARMIERLVPQARRLRPIETVETLNRSIAFEMDLRLEAAAASELADNIEDDEGVGVPTVDWDRTGRRVLTTTWIDGVPLHDRDGLVAAGHDPAALAARFAEMFLNCALRDGFFHADMHPGNIFVQADGRLVAVDFGIMGRLHPDNRRYLAEILYGVIERDYLRVAHLHYEAGLVPDTQPVEDFALALRSMGEPIFGRDADNMNMSRVLGRLFEVTDQFNMATQPELLFLQKTMIVVEGVARSLDPNFNLWEVGRPVLEHWVRDMVGPEARLREGVELVEQILRRLPLLLDRLEGDAASEGAPAMMRATINDQETPENSGSAVVWGLLAIIAGAAAGLLLV